MFSNIKPKWYIGIGVLAITIVFFILGAAPLQTRFGMWGLALTELVILLFALIPAWLFKWKLKDIFPVRRISPGQLLATVLLFFATYFVVLAISLITGYLFPQALQTGNELSGFYSSVPLLLSLIIMGVMPGVCEEALHRGLILHTVRNRNNDAITLIVMAVIFGVFHLDPYRFLPTAVIGLVLTWIMLKTGNILLPMLFHAINNSVTAFISYGADTSQTVSPSLSVTGAWLILCAASPFLFFAAARLLNKDKDKRRTKKIFIAVAIAVLLAAAGVLLVSLPAESPGKTPVLNFSFTENADNGTLPSVHEFNVEKAGAHDISFSIKAENNNCVTAVSFENEDGEAIWEPGAGADWSANRHIYLEAGKYRVSFIYDCQSGQTVKVDIAFRIDLLE